MKNVNRFALIMTGKPAFFAMLTQISGEQYETPAPTENDLSHVYLIPGDFTYHQDALEWIEENRQIFFETEVEGWFTDETKFPKNISWTDFQDYFVFSIQSMVIDSMPDDPVYDEE